MVQTVHLWFHDLSLLAYQNGLHHKKLDIEDGLVEDDPEALNDMKKLERFVMVAIWCLQEGPSLRPTMKARR
ncbi:hypothetical protein FH972_009672 [Carpinus fangiana]|uniref:Serine-threonine/tyrosine-protein kinase catalytic domain-containing protein n=1 Tax=Carpinus fangiana TaxID=176857 RepID=A0A660KSX3_9ROSI|nr:hypothetical protein FH972_009672 [Carpinus fangiana]